MVERVADPLAKLQDRFVLPVLDASLLAQCPLPRWPDRVTVYYTSKSPKTTNLGICSLLSRNQSPFGTFNTASCLLRLTHHPVPLPPPFRSLRQTDRCSDGTNAKRVINRVLHLFLLLLLRCGMERRGMGESESESERVERRGTEKAIISLLQQAITRFCRE